VSATGRSLITLQTRVRYTTMVLLGWRGDPRRHLWRQGLSHRGDAQHRAREARRGRHEHEPRDGQRCRLPFLLTEKAAPARPTSRVREPDRARRGKPSCYSAAQLELRSELEEARAATDAANRRTTEALAAYQQEYPGKLQFVYGPQRYTKPFLVRSIWNDGQFTYIKSDATELPALYELKDGKPGLLNFQVQNGTYIVPKVLDRGYLSLGKERFEFLQEGR
jgi:hypothetical protein